MQKDVITIDKLKSLLDYNCLTGDFIYKRTNGRAIKGNVAGTVLEQGYRRIKIDGIFYLAHRLVWFYHNKFFPENTIDHINGIRSDNRIENLRLASASENQQNKRCAQKNNKTNLLGVCKSRNRWKAQIQIDRKVIYIGTYDSKEDAHMAYLKRKAELHPHQTIT